MTRRAKQSGRDIFATNLRRMRLAIGLSQEAFADRCGLHRTYIGAIERGEKNVSVDNMERVARALNCPIADLLAIEEASE